MAVDSGWSTSGEDPNQYKAPVPCYNCGSPDHLFTACPEPTRAVPAGLAASVAKNAARQAESVAWRTPDYAAKWKNGQMQPKFPYKKPPVITRFAPPGSNVSQQFQGSHEQAPPSHYYQAQPTPPVQDYDQYGQQPGPPVLQPNYPPAQGYDQHSQSGYPAPQPQHAQHVPQYPAQYPSQQGPHHNYQNGQQHGYQHNYHNGYPDSGPQNGYPVYQDGAQNGQQHGYQNVPSNSYPNSYENGYQNGYQHHGQQESYQQNSLHYNANQQPGYAAYPQPQPPPPVTFNQNQGPMEWGQPPPPAPYDQQQHGQQFNPAAQSYYAQPQPHYPHDGSYNQLPPPPNNTAGTHMPVQPIQQYADAQYTSPQQQFAQPSGYPYNEYSQNGEANPQLAGSSFTEQPAYPPPSCVSTHGSSIFSQPQGPGTYQPDYIEATDEEEIEWMLERLLKRRMESSGITKATQDLTAEEYYALLSDDEQTIAVDPIGQPLPHTFNDDVILPPAYGATCATSKYITPDNAAEFTKSVRHQQLLSEFARDPVFLRADLDTWHREYGRRVEHLSRASFLRTHGTPGEPRSRKRQSSSYDDESSAESRSGEGNQERPLPQVIQNKRPRVNGAGFKYKRLQAVENSNPAPERDTTPSVGREPTPTFDLGGGTPNGEADPWAIEPGEGAIREDHHQQPSERVQGNVNGHNFGSSTGARQSYNNRVPIHMIKNYGQSPGSNDYSHTPRRQDSGYVSGRSSFTGSTDKPPNGAYVENKNGHNLFFNPTKVGQRSRQYHNQDNMVLGSPMSSDSEHFRAGTSPLTPASTELLNPNHALPLLDQTNSKKQDLQRQQDDVTPRPKRPQPQVEAVYSRRW